MFSVYLVWHFGKKDICLTGLAHCSQVSEFRCDLRLDFSFKQKSLQVTVAVYLSSGTYTDVNATVKHSHFCVMIYSLAEVQDCGFVFAASPKPET